MKDTRFALVSTYNKIKFDDGSERISLSAPFIVSNDGMLSKTFNECRKLKLPFRVIGFFNPLLLNKNELLSNEVLFNLGEDQDGKPICISSPGVSFAVFRDRLFECAAQRGFELLYQGYNEWKKQYDSKGDIQNVDENND